MSRVFTKTAKGFRESSGKTQDLPEDLRELLRVCKGQFAVEDFASPDDDKETIAGLLDELVTQGFLREIHELSSGTPEEMARREAEELARFDAEEEARLAAGAAEKARQAEQEARAEASERAALKAAKQRRQEEETKERARQEEERDRELIRERVRERASRNPRPSLKATVAAILVLVVAAAGLLQVVAFEGKRLAFETLATNTLRSPVKIGRANFGFIPSPRWQLSDVRVGESETGVTLKRVIVESSWLSLFTLPTEFSSIQLESVNLSMATLGNVLHDTEVRLPIKTGHLGVRALNVSSEQKLLPALDLDVLLHEGQLAHISGTGKDDDFGKFTFDAQRFPTHWLVTATAERYVIPLGVNFPVTDLKAKMELAPDGLTVTEFFGRRFDGELRASGQIRWSGNWQAKVALDVQRLDVTQLAPGWGKEGVVGGRLDWTAEAMQEKQLFANSRSEGSFSMVNGALKGLDLDKVVQGRGIGDESRFESLQGRVRSNASRLEFSDIRLSAGGLGAVGAITVMPDRTVSGRIGIEVKTSGAKLTSSLVVSGMLDRPQFSH